MRVVSDKVRRAQSRESKLTVSGPIEKNGGHPSPANLVRLFKSSLCAPLIDRTQFVHVAFSTCRILQFELLNTIATRNKRFGRIHSEQNPATSRSKTRRFGARRRERFRIKS